MDEQMDRQMDEQIALSFDVNVKEPVITRESIVRFSFENKL